MNAEEILASALRFQQAGRWREALELYLQLLPTKGSDPLLRYNIGLVYRRMGRTNDAAVEFSNSLRLKPEFPEAENNLGNALASLRRMDEAVAAYRRALALRPDFPDAWSNLGVTLKTLGMVKEALVCFERSGCLVSGNHVIGSNYLYSLHFSPDADPLSLRQSHEQWRFVNASGFEQVSGAPCVDPEPERRLRIGYVSAAFREHCQSLFTLPLFSHHDRRAFEIHCYSDAERPDAITDRLKGLADVWRDCAGRSDEEVSRLVRQDRIDVLVDLMVHLPGNRLLSFARRPAPVQVSWLGYPGSTGLRTIDYRITDHWLDPPGANDEFYSERSFRLPDSFWCYCPLNTNLTANKLPAKERGHITFGCLNNFTKVNEPLLDMWSDVLRSVPASRLLLLAPDGSSRDRVRKLLNIEAERLEFTDFMPRDDYLEQYHRIDLCLDTFPYNGHTTSLDALWMGVPVVSLCGPIAVSRAGLSLSASLGLPGLVANSREEFVEIATKLAGDLSVLETLRSTLRTRMLNSPLMDGVRFARNIEAAYRSMWRERCAAEAAAGAPPPA